MLQRVLLHAYSCLEHDPHNFSPFLTVLSNSIPKVINKYSYNHTITTTVRKKGEEMRGGGEDKNGCLAAFLSRSTEN